MELTQVRVDVTFKSVEAKIDDMELLVAICERLRVPITFLTGASKIEDGVIYNWKDVGTHCSRYAWVKQTRIDVEESNRINQNFETIKELAKKMGYSEIHEWQLRGHGGW